MSKIETIFATHDAPWDIIEFDAKSKYLRESGCYFGIESKSERRIAGHVPLATAMLIAIAPEMAVFVERIANDGQSEYQHEAKLLLSMMAVRNLIRKEQ